MLSTISLSLSFIRLVPGRRLRNPQVFVRFMMFVMLCIPVDVVIRFNAAAEKLAQDAARLESELEAAQVRNLTLILVQC